MSAASQAEEQERKAVDALRRAGTLETENVRLRTRLSRAETRIRQLEEELVDKDVEISNLRAHAKEAFSQDGP